MTSDITKPELCYMNTMQSLAANPAAPMNVMQGTPFLDTIMQPRFRGAWTEREAADLAGKAKPTLSSLNAGINKRRKYYEYEKPYCETEANGAPSNVCEDGDATEETVGYLSSDIDQVFSEKWTITKEEFRNLAEQPSERRAEMLRRKAWNLKKKINRAAITQSYAAVSDYFNGEASIGTTARNVTILSSKGDILPVGMAKLKKEYRQTGFQGDFVTFGGETMATYFDVRELRLSPEGRLGVQFNESMTMVYDPIFDEVYQTLEEDVASHGITIPYGAFSLDFWYSYTGEMIDVYEDHLSTTIEIDGMLYDYELHYNKCGTKKWTEQLSINFGFLTIPDAVYCDGTGLIKHWKFNCGDVDCDTFC